MDVVEKARMNSTWIYLMTMKNKHLFFRRQDVTPDLITEVINNDCTKLIWIIKNQKIKITFSPVP